jgi:alkanesulfonate monooxygenase SsuD/methylene tetrahydromethanopterin reductase-like flavin-dependent oxidoreductase (luciferase family)
MDYGHDLLFGTFITPTAEPPHHAVELAVVAGRAGLDLVTFQGHPYQPGFLDTWSLLTYVTARTSRVRLSHNVLNLPLRPPSCWLAPHPREAVEALEEAITIIREVWASDKPGGVVFDGKHHSVCGAPRGPAPAHEVGIWAGAGMPRMLRLVGRMADGWSVPIRLFLPGGPPTLAETNRVIDEAAIAAGRDPRP